MSRSGEAEYVVTEADAKNRLESLISRATESGETVVIEREGKPPAAIISLEQYRQLRTIEEQERRRQVWEELEALRAEVSAQFLDMGEEEREKLVQQMRDEVMQAVVEKSGLYKTP